LFSWVIPKNVNVFQKGSRLSNAFLRIIWRETNVKIIILINRILEPENYAFNFV